MIEVTVNGGMGQEDYNDGGYTNKRGMDGVSTQQIRMIIHVQ